jgi:hypothetical protein
MTPEQIRRIREALRFMGDACSPVAVTYDLLRP